MPLRLRQDAGPVEHRIEQPLQAGVRQRRLLGQPGAGEHSAALGGVAVGVADQRAAARSRLAVQHQGAAAVGHAGQQVPDSSALVVPAAQYGYLHS
ncbi:hypothetical protein GCM10027614_03550 [Micromonospora vulcania]